MSGLTPLWLPGEIMAAATKSSLDLVEDQERAVVVAEGAGGGEVAGGKGSQAALDLDWLQEEGGDVAGGKGLFEGGEVAEGDRLAAGEEGGEGALEAGVSGEGECSEGEAVVGTFEGEEARTVGGGAGEPHRGVDGLGAGGGEEDGGEAGASGEARLELVGAGAFVLAPGFLIKGMLEADPEALGVVTEGHGASPGEGVEVAVGRGDLRGARSGRG
jgi:hypothetical protein